MQTHAEEVMLARERAASVSFESLRPEQIQRIMTRGRELYRWFRAHPVFHCIINAALLLFLLGGDLFVALKLPAFCLHAKEPNLFASTLVASLVCGVLRCWILYSITVFTMHEGAAHQMIFPPRGRISRTANYIASNLCRIVASDPVYYAERHMIHHSKFGTEEDAEFLNFVTPRRYWSTFLPLAMMINFSDFVVHRPLRLTKSSAVTALIGLAYQGFLGYTMYRTWGLVFAIAETMLLLHLGFYLDRLRQFTEHNLMPLDNANGSRSLGVGFWGILIGGGPWGQPCHWEHHLVASIPWCQQILLHRFVVRLLTQRQREQFLLKPVIGFPILWWRLVRESTSFVRTMPQSVGVRKFAE